MPKFNREQREQTTKFWRLAASLECPKCGNRLYGDKEFAWCKSYDCTFFCPWSGLLFLDDTHLYTEKYKGTLKQQDDLVCIFWDEEKGKLLKVSLEEIE